MFISQFYFPIIIKKSVRYFFSKNTKKIIHNFKKKPVGWGVKNHFRTFFLAFVEGK